MDILLLASGLNNRVRDVLLSVVRANAKTAAMPVLTLSAAIADVLDEESRVSVAWASRIEELVQAIEAALTDARRNELRRITNVRALGDPLMAEQENAPNQPQPLRYHSDHIYLPADTEAARVILHEVFNERLGRGWKLMSATKEPTS